MIYAAWFEIHNDDVVVSHPIAFRVYAHLLRNPLVFMHPQVVKVWLLAELLHTHRDRVSLALNLLVARGYLLEHERGLNNVRRFTVTMERQTTRPPNEAASPAA